MASGGSASAVATAVAMSELGERRGSCDVADETAQPSRNV